MGAKILIIDDELQIRKLVRINLRAHGFSTMESSTGNDGMLQAARVRPDLILLDLGLPDMDGIEVLIQLREFSTAPIIVLSVRGDEQSKVSVLDQGADDYVTKPFMTGELMARIRVALRHTAHQTSEPVLHLGQLTIDLPTRAVHRNGNLLKLTPIEYDILKTLAINEGRVMTHNQLIQQIWKDRNYDVASNNLRVYIGHLRKKIEDDPQWPKYIITEPGVGYRFVAD